MLLMVAPSVKVLLGMLRVQWTLPPSNLEFSSHLQKFRFPRSIPLGCCAGGRQVTELRTSLPQWV